MTTAMLEQCHGPTWHNDDLSHCFQTQYLQTLFPLLSCALSLAAIVAKLLYVRVSQSVKSNSQYLVLVYGNEEEDLADEQDSVADLTLQKTTSHAHLSSFEVDKPIAQTTSVSIELAALVAQIVISSCRLVLKKHYEDRGARLAAISSIVVWAYIAVLVSSRLFFSTTKWKLSIVRLWNHTAILYGVQWLLEVLVFRSAIIHPRDSLTQHLTITSFALTSLLAGIALVSRRGNREVALESEGEILPSKEPLASILSQLTFTWVDGLIWKGFRKPLEMQDVWNVTISDKAEVVLVQFRQVKKTHKLAARLLWFFKRQLLVQGTWCAVGSVFMFLPTLLLKAILEHLEHPDSVSSNAAWLFVTLLFCSGLVSAVSDGQALWMGRRICVQLRGLIIGEIYSKVLRRKAAASAETDLGAPEPQQPLTFWQRVKSWRRKAAPEVSQSQTIAAKSNDTQINNGTVINLMSIDSFKVAEISSFLHFLWVATPVQLFMAVTLLWNVLGASAMVGIVMMIMCLPLNIYIARSFQKAQKNIMSATDARIHATNEVLQNIRIIKYFAWEPRFEANVKVKRQKELAALWRKYVLWSAAATVWSATPIIITFATFLVFTVVEKKRLVPSVAFPALSMFSLLRIPLDLLADMLAHVQESKVSIDRVEEFLNEDETERYQQLKASQQASPYETRIGLHNATLAWGSAPSGSGTESPATFRLIDMNVEFLIGKLNVIVGATGSGKTSLLMALLGEMKLISGQVLIPGGLSRQDLHRDPETGLTESVAYCAQQAWLVNATIRENILFDSPFEANRYKAVIAATALARDLEILDAGDQTLVGEKGITLSGGQKQRISLARALYSTSKHILLDDCLSAVDSHTAKHIYEEAVLGNLMQHRTCILVSHNIVLTVPKADMIVVLNNGKISAQGPPEKVIQSGILGEEILRSRPASLQQSAAPSRRASEEDLTSGQQNGHADHTASEHGGANKAFVDTRLETKATGSVKLSLIQVYLGSMGPWYYWIFAVFGFIAVQLGSVATNVWIRQWSNAYATESEPLTFSSGFLQFPTVRTYSLAGGLSIQIPVFTFNSTAKTFKTIDGGVDVGYYLGVYAVIAAGYIVICFSRELVLFWGSIKAAQAFHERLLHNILGATFRFFDSTPLGQMTNRFSKDVQSIDQEVAPVAIGMFHSLAAVVTIVVLIASITPGFLIPGVFIACIYITTGFFYVRSSRDLKRLESVERSPLFQHFGETLSGVVTIRAYGEEARFVRDTQHKINTYNRPFMFLWATNRWLAFRIDGAGALVSFFAAAFIVLNRGRIDAGTAGLSLTYAITFTQNVLWLVRLYAGNEQNMNSVERVQEYIDIEQEAPAHIPENKPSTDWPTRGSVEFLDYTTRYRKDLDPVLRHLTFTIQAGEKIGIVGRTGAGKSSLALALFRGLEAEGGKILIDGVDIGMIGLQDLRRAITIVPQDPTLFTGTLRNNLDPFELFTDEDIFTALRRVQLISSNDQVCKSLASSSSTSSDSDEPTQGTVMSGSTIVRSVSNAKDINLNMFHNLSSPIAESGSNISQGQRQLLCLARALLKSPRVLIMDEATASIDYATDSKIQDTLRELKNNTIITIAHRLQTIIDYDKVLVLDKGELVEFADPYELIRKADGSFRKMCENSGDLELLMTLSRKAWEGRRLVDDE